MADRWIVGDTVHVSNTFKVSGTATDPTTVTLTVTDPSGNTDSYTYAGSTVTKSSTGVYYRNVTVDEDGVWEYKWTGTGTAADIATGTFTVYLADVDDIDVLTLTEAKAAVGLAQTNTDADERLAQAITAISAQLDELCGPVRTRTVTSETHDGGGYSIQLRRIPVYSITTVTEYTGTTSQVLTAETNATKTATNYLHDGTAGKVISGRLIRRSSNYDTTYPSGRRNVEVTYVAGRAAATEVVPARFKESASMMLRHIWTAEMASGTETYNAFATQEFNPLLGPGMLNKVAAILQGEMLEGVGAV